MLNLNMQNRLIIIIIIIIIIIFNKVLNLTTDRAILKKSSTCTTTAIRRGETGSSKAKLEYYASSQTKTGNLMNLFRNVVGPKHEPQSVTTTTHDPLVHMTVSPIRSSPNRASSKALRNPAGNCFNLNLE
ncbi:hypothetical protein TWF102_007681 [Orbilia oligospora]|uniref:Uncharacterized protein n=1 Tax=Orbilia oligospora TaxID=2813651 RepID=A0A7C8N618_ORBOL|nr:hypothetical protein TWF102_007681 [Orbilia oligospora]